jgi:hypothetical protein
MIGWYFAPDDRKLRYGDGRAIETGVTHRVACRPVLCEAGLHASERILDALQYAPGSVICRVRLGGEIVRGVDKSCATKRTYLAVIDGEILLRAFARRCALDVIHLWQEAPAVVREYLETGDENLRTAASDAAWAAAKAVAWDAARAAAWTAARAAARGAAWSVARAAAEAAAEAAATDAAWIAVGDIVWTIARGKQNEQLKAMALASIAGTSVA